MDSKGFLKELKSQLEEDEKELSEVDRLIKTMKDAGENTAQLEATQRQLRSKIDRWKKAIDKNV